MFLRQIHVTILLAGVLFALASDTVAAEKTCIDCHKKVTAKRVIHPALSQYARMEQGCDSCHTAPHAKKKGALSLSAAVPELCFQCHDKTNFTKAYVHPPVAGGDCLTCHNPHASDIPHLLTQQVRQLCKTCHPDKTNGKHILGGYGFGDNHPIMGKLDPSHKGQELGCTSCHNPHSSGKKSLLVNDRTDSPENLCFVCHTKIKVRP